MRNTYFATAADVIARFQDQVSGKMIAKGPKFNLVTRRTTLSMSTALLLSVIRQVHTSAPPPRLTKFALRPPKAVEVEYSDGSAFHLSAEFLRVYSPAVDSKIRMIGGEKVIAGRRHVGIMSAEPVGNYGVRIIFDDLHKTGIYTWDYFYQLGAKKFNLMRNYIKTLKKHGLSRDPKRRT